MFIDIVPAPLPLRTSGLSLLAEQIFMRALTQPLMVTILLVFVPALAGAQAGAALTGIVTDTSGAVLPGVTVEARSPSLIEQVRSAVTDETGRYRIVDLRPGTYAVTFGLPGFATVTRGGIEL